MAHTFRQLRLFNIDGSGSIKVQIGWDNSPELVTCPRGIFPEKFETKFDLGDGASLTLKAQVIDSHPTITSITTTGVDLISFLSDEAKPADLGRAFQNSLIDAVAGLFGPTGNQAHGFYQVEVQGQQPIEDLKAYEHEAWFRGDFPTDFPLELRTLTDPLGMIQWREQRLAEDEIIRKTHRQIRARMTPERLKEIATVYTLNIPNGLEAVQEQVRPYGPKHKISRATAARYVRQAREAGLIVDRRRNKSS